MNMMKKTIPLLMGIGLFCNAQIGIGTTAVASSEALVISSKPTPTTPKYRGLLLPRVALTSETDNTTIPAASPLLTVYKTTGLKGFYFWDTSAAPTPRWQRAYDKPGVLQLIVPVKNDTNSSTGGATQNSGLGGATGYTAGLTTGELKTAHNWVAIPGLSRTINVVSAVNSITVGGSGTLQLNNATPGTDDQGHSFAIGIFVNDKLFSVRTYIATGDYGMTCLANSFDIKANLQNVPIATYKIEVYAVTRASLTGNATTLTWAAPAASCTNLNAFMTQSNLSLQSQQF